MLQKELLIYLQEARSDRPAQNRSKRAVIMTTGRDQAAAVPLQRRCQLLQGNLPISSSTTSGAAPVMELQSDTRRAIAGILESMLPLPALLRNCKRMARLWMLVKCWLSCKSESTLRNLPAL